jgi:uncharacterized protein (TIGR00369 family)
MAVTDTIARFAPNFSIESGDRNFVKDAWDRLHKVPGGKAVFSKLIGRVAPYTGTVGARVESLSMGRAEVRMKDRPHVRNHLKCVHAVALVNLAELTGNVALAYSMPSDARFIVAGLSIDYLKKARGTLKGVCECPVVTSNEKHEYQVPVSIQNTAGEEVARVTLRTLVGPKKKH